MRRVLAALSFATLALTAAPARADDKESCLAAHGSAQVLKKEGKFQAAEGELLVCSRSQCPPLVATDCVQWLTEIRAEQPTVILSATDEHGRESANVVILLDGHLLTRRLDGLPMAVDPGEHTFRYESESGSVAEERVVLRAGEKHRLLRVAFPLAEPQGGGQGRPGPTGGRSIPTGSWVAAGVAVAAAGAWALLGLTGKSREATLAETCAPGCARDDIDDVSRRYLFADVALGVSAAALATAVVLVLVTKPSSNQALSNGTSLRVRF